MNTQKSQEVGAAKAVSTFTDEPEVWYTIESSFTGRDDWFATGDRFDSVNSARLALEGHSSRRNTLGEFEYRIVRKTLTSEVL